MRAVSLRTVPPRAWLVIAGLVVLIVVAMTLTFRRGHEQHEVSAPLGNRSAATFELVSGATSVTVRSADLGGELLRAKSPGRIPHLDRDGDVVRLSLDGGNPSTVEIRLSSRVRWQLRFVSGATDERVDLSSGRVAGVEVVGGVSNLDIALPHPDGTVTVRMSGGAGRFAVRAPSGVPVQARLDSGAGSVIVDGSPHNGLSAGTVVATADWEQARNRYAIEAAAGVSTLTVDRS
jgi:hypothetical protein